MRPRREITKGDIAEADARVRAATGGAGPWATRAGAALVWTAIGLVLLATVLAGAWATAELYGQAADAWRDAIAGCDR